MIVEQGAVFARVPELLRRAEVLLDEVAKSLPDFVPPRIAVQRAVPLGAPAEPVAA